MMKQFLFTILTISILFACTKKPVGNMIVQGEIKNLKKGTVYLEKRQDSILIAIDSVNVDGEGKFKLSSTIESAELFFLSLDKLEDKTIPFFGEMSTITINTTLDKFLLQAKITGSKNQEVLDEYNKISSIYKNRNLELIKAKFEAQKEQNQKKYDSILNKSKNLSIRNYLAIVNFAVQNGDSEVAPFLAINKLKSTNTKFLDTIYNSLSERVKNSTYGKDLTSFIERKKQEN